MERQTCAFILNVSASCEFGVEDNHAQARNEANMHSGTTQLDNCQLQNYHNTDNLRGVVDL